MDPTTAPLLISADELLVADVLRLGAAAGVTPEVERDPAAALRRWSRAGLVLLDPAAAAELGPTAPPRRDRVHVVGRGDPPATSFRDAVAVGAERVLALPAAEDWLVELLTDAVDRAGGGAQAGPAVTIGVLGGCGGAGATVFACALAQTAARSLPTVLIDADPLGAGADRVLGLESAPGVRWDAFTKTTGRLGARSLREALPSAEGLSLVAWPPERSAELPATAMREVVSAARRGHGVVVIDLPRQPSVVGEETISRCDHLVLLSTLRLPAVGASARIAARLPREQPTTHLVTRGNGVPAADLARLLGLPLLAAMRSERGLDETIDLGVGPIRRRRGPLARAARAATIALIGPAALR